MLIGRGAGGEAAAGEHRAEKNDPLFSGWAASVVGRLGHEHNFMGSLAMNWRSGCVHKSAFADTFMAVGW